MGLLDNTTQAEYYQGNNYGNYQFVSLDDIINQFQIMYVGEDKLIPKAKRADIAFHAQRALAELSFDTFKSFKSQQIELPPSLTMVLPHDYVNYTKVSYVDSAGIKHPIYPTKHTSNPFQIKQDDDGGYTFTAGTENLLINGDFSIPKQGWKIEGGNAETGILSFTHQSHTVDGQPTGKVFQAQQAIDVSNVNFINVSADGVANVASGVGVSAIPNGILRLGLTSQNPNEPGFADIPGGQTTWSGNVIIPGSLFANTDIFDVDGGAYIEWEGVSTTQTMSNVDVSQYDQVWVVIVSMVNHVNDPATPLVGTNTIDNVSVINALGGSALQHANTNAMDSSTWDSYKSNTISEDSIDDYRYEQHWLNPNERYGLDPTFANINGNFYIDERLGRIHFSSNISGKTVILDYISDSLGTDAEMQVPKLAEDAMYKHILYDVISSRSNIGGGRLSFHKKEKFAAVRKAKLRLSNIKLEELAQILRGQSKHIKH
tara:strand:+ start:702 stop:2162 length:1461 start_codon:yes stop_codon:yes gene_type:complete